LIHDIEPLDISPASIDLQELKLLGQGRTAEVFLLRDRFVIKVFRLNFPKPAIDNEYLVCRAIGSIIDIPKAHQRLVVAGRDAIIFDFIKGESGFRHLFRNPWSIALFAREFAAIHARIHSTSVPDEVPELKSILVRNINLHDHLTTESKTKIIKYLDHLPGENKLCHGDFHPENILMNGRKPVVLDWMTATRGNPLADVARTSILLKWAEPGPGTPSFIKALLGSVRRKFHRHYLGEYQRLTGARQDAIEDWELPVLAARLMEWLPGSEKQALITIVSEKLKRLY
jgi:aminoglycoside phosphotransferase (APT) family kinase protein